MQSSRLVKPQPGRNSTKKSELKQSDSDVILIPKPDMELVRVTKEFD
jgi:hypothetical protein